MGTPRYISIFLWSFSLFTFAAGVRCEAPVWTMVSTTGPSGRSDHAMAYEPIRDMVVLFGGWDTKACGDTWQWDGAAWSELNVTGPSARWRHAMIFDPTRGSIILHGGRDGSGSLSEMWEWNGTAWAQIPGTGPSARDGHSMVHDSSRGQIVLFGGNAGSAYLGDTWEWNGSAWTQKSTSGPAPRDDAGMAFDAARGKTVLFGGTDGARFSDTWEWDGTAWTQKATTGPSSRSGHSMAYDSARQRVVLFGGYDGSTYFDDTWEWDGTSWQQIVVSGPSGRDEAAMVYDSAKDRMVLFGGNYQTDTWTFGAGGESAVVKDFYVPFTTTSPSIDGSVAEDPGWTISLPETLAFEKDKTTGTRNAVIRMVHDSQFLYVAMQTDTTDAWDSHAWVRLDGNNSGTLDGSPMEPHVDIQTECPAPGGWPGYDVCSYWNGTTYDYVSCPTGTDTASANPTALAYEFKIPLSDLTLSPGNRARLLMYLAQGAEPGAVDGSFYPSPSSQLNPTQWARLTLGSATDFYVPYTAKSKPAIDGTIAGDHGWDNTHPIPVVGFQVDGDTKRTQSVSLVHDGEFLYVGIQTETTAAWDTHAWVRFDGNYSGTLDGSSIAPHIDAQIEQSAPGGWPGYDKYAYWNGSNYGYVTRPDGTDSASANPEGVSYEYKIPLSDLTLAPGGTAGMLILTSQGLGAGQVTDCVYPHPSVMMLPNRYARIRLAPVGIPWGDLNKDGVFDIRDATLAIRVLAGLDTPPS